VTDCPLNYILDVSYEPGTLTDLCLRVVCVPAATDDKWPRLTFEFTVVNGFVHTPAGYAHNESGAKEYVRYWLNIHSLE
jgi:hypothetical protein